MTKFVAMLFMAILMTGSAILVMTCGWGMKPQSWWWIIGGGIFAETALSHIAWTIAKERA